MAEDRALLAGREGAKGDGRGLRVGSRSLSAKQARRDDRAHGQRLYPAIEFEDGTWYREESRHMEATIRDGELIERGPLGAIAMPARVS
jgi:hypothetical protein